MLIVFWALLSLQRASAGCPGSSGDLHDGTFKLDGWTTFTGIATDYHQFGELPLTAGQKFSFATWYRFNYYNQYNRIFDLGPSSSSTNIRLHINGVGTMRFNRPGKNWDHNGFHVAGVDYDASTRQFQWIHIAVTVDTDGSMTIYKNGVLYGSSSGSLIVAGTLDNNYIAKSSWCGPSCEPNSNMDTYNLKFYDVVLDAACVSSLYADTPHLCGNEELEAPHEECDDTEGLCVDCACVATSYYSEVKLACEDCHCVTANTVGASANCDASGCSCSAGATGFMCDTCTSTYYLSGDTCLACNCDTVNTVGSSASCAAGQCTCRVGAQGLTCSECTDGYYENDSGLCTECECQTLNTVGASGTCAAGGQCECAPSATGLRCDTCASGYWSDEGLCTVCGCVTENTEGNSADCVDGVCNCKPGSGGSTCSGCEDGTYKDGLECKPCLAGCRICADATSCSVCEGPHASPFPSPGAAGGECRCDHGYSGTDGLLCTEVPCSADVDLTSRPNVVAGDCLSGLVLGATCSVSCAVGYTRVFGDELTACAGVAVGASAITVPTLVCAEVTCPALIPAGVGLMVDACPDGGLHSIASPSQCSFKCGAGYAPVLASASTGTCTAIAVDVAQYSPFPLISCAPRPAVLYVSIATSNFNKRVMAGDNVTVMFGTNEPVEVLAMTILGRVVTPSSVNGSGMVWSATVVVLDVDSAPGFLPFSVGPVRNTNSYINEEGAITDVTMGARLCRPGYFGLTCGTECGCVNGYCDNGPFGNGACSSCFSRTGWIASNCDLCLGEIDRTLSGWYWPANVSAAPTEELRCDRCEGLFYGETCTGKCQCNVLSTCASGIDGDGSCTCSAPGQTSVNGWTGTYCDNCPKPWYGEQCDRTCGCDQSVGECNSGVKGDGTCTECFVNTRWGEYCNNTCSCFVSNGICDNNVDGNGLCKSCKNGWTGDTCAVCGPGQHGLNCNEYCPVGTISHSGETWCTPCSENLVATTPGSSECTPCREGEAPNTDLSECIPCVEGFFASSSGLPTCQACPEGMHNSAQGQSECKRCGLGWYADATGWAECKQCPAGSFSNSTGTVTCTKCEPGYHATDLGNTKCVPCGRGQYSNTTGAPTCSLCPPGHYSNHTGMSECVPCALGEHTRDEGQTGCSECPENEYADSEGLEVCHACPEHTHTDIAGASRSSQCVCDVHYYLKEDVCTECPTGGTCLGAYSRPLPGDGFYGSTVSPNGEFIFVACTPSEACVGGGQCREGYTGERCGDCAPGFYQLGGKCERCPDNTSWRIAAFIFMSIALLVVMVVTLDRYKKQALDLSQHFHVKQRAALVGIALNFIQVIAIFEKLDMAWPGPVRFVFNFFSIANLNIDLLASECTVETPYETKWAVAVTLPVILATALLVGWLLAETLRVNVPALRSKIPQLDMDSFISIGSMLMVYSFLFVVQKALEVFDCSPNEDGTRTFQPAPSRLCFEPWWHEFLPAALVALVFYAIVFPFGLMWMIFKDRDHLADPSHNVHRRFAMVYQHYHLEFYYWNHVIMLRKFAVAIALLSVWDHPVIQALIALVALIGSLFAHLKSSAYLEKNQNDLEAILLFGGVIVLLFGQVFYSLRDDLDDTTRVVFAWIVVVVLCSAVLAVLVYMVYSIFFATYDDGMELTFTSEGKTRRLTISHNMMTEIFDVIIPEEDDAAGGQCNDDGGNNEDVEDLDGGGIDDVDDDHFGCEDFDEIKTVE